MSEKLCIFCKYFSYENISEWQSECSGGSDGGYNCGKGKYSDERPWDEDELRKILLRANKCQFYTPPESV